MTTTKRPWIVFLNNNHWGVICRPIQPRFLHACTYNRRTLREQTDPKYEKSMFYEIGERLFEWLLSIVIYQFYFDFPEIDSISLGLFLFKQSETGPRIKRVLKNQFIFAEEIPLFWSRNKIYCTQSILSQPREKIHMSDRNWILYRNFVGNKSVTTYY